MINTAQTREVDDGDLAFLRHALQEAELPFEGLSLDSPTANLGAADPDDQLAIVLALTEYYDTAAPKGMISETVFVECATARDLLRTVKNWQPAITPDDIALFTNILSLETAVKSPPRLDEDTLMSSFNLGEFDWANLVASLEEAYGVKIPAESTTASIVADVSTVGDLIGFVKGCEKDPESCVTVVGHITYTVEQVLSAVTDEITAKVGQRAAEHGGNFDRGETLGSIGIGCIRNFRLPGLIINLEERVGIPHRIPRKDINGDTQIGTLADAAAKVLTAQGRMRQQ